MQQKLGSNHEKPTFTKPWVVLERQESTQTRGESAVYLGSGQRGKGLQGAGEKLYGVFSHDENCKLKAQGDTITHL